MEMEEVSNKDQGPEICVEKKKESSIGHEITSLCVLQSSLLIATSKPGNLEIIDSSTGSILYEAPNYEGEREKKECTYLCHYLRNTQKLLVARDNNLKLLCVTPQNTLLLGSTTISSTSMQLGMGLQLEPGKESIFTIEIPLKEALRVLAALQETKFEGKVSETVQQDLKELEKQLEDHSTKVIATASSNKSLYWSTCCLRMPYSNLKSVCWVLLEHFDVAKSEAVSAIQSILEELRISAQAIGDSELATTQEKSNMSNERVRLQTFKDWPGSDNPQATPANLARAGLFYQPLPSQVSVSSQTKISGMDRCVCFKCKGVFSGWDSLGNPWLEHCSQIPNCGFVQGKETSNVPLSASLTALPFEKHGSESQPICRIISLENSNTVATISADGKVVVWDTSTELQQYLSLNALENDGTELINAVLLPCNPLDDEIQEKQLVDKWTDWCTVDINVEVRQRGLYPGAKGVVFDILSEDLCCVFLSGINEMITFPPDHLKPLQPKVKEKVKVLKGEDKGRTGTLLGLQASKGIVRFPKKEVKMLDLAWLASMASNETEEKSSEGEECCVLTVIRESSGTCFLNLYEMNKGSGKFLQAISLQERGTVTGVEYIGSLGILVAATNRGLITFSFDPISRRLIEEKTLSIDIEPTLKIFHTITPGGTNLLVVTSRTGRVHVIDAKSVTLLQSFVPGSVHTFVEAVFLPDINQLCMATDSQEIHYLSILKSENYEGSIEGFDLGPITLSNLSPIKQLDLDKLEYFAYPPPDIKQHMTQEKDGSSCTWLILPENLRLNGDVNFELEFMDIQMLDRFDFNLGFHASTSEFSVDTIGGPYSISIKYLDPTTGQHEEFLEEFDLTTLIFNSSEGTDTSPLSNQVNCHVRSISLNVQITARNVYFTIHHLEPEAISPSFLTLLNLSVYGTNSKNSVATTQRMRRQALFENKEYHLSLLKTCLEPTPIDLRDLCLTLLWLIWTATDEVDHILGALDVQKFVEINIISSSTVIARLASRILLIASESSDTFKKTLFKVCLQVLPVVVETCYSAGGMHQFFTLLAHSWSEDPSSAFQVCVESLCKLGEELYQNRSPFYNILKTHFGLYGNPLELDLFQTKTIEEIRNGPHHDNLSFSFSDKCNNASTDAKQQRIRFSRIQKTGNWVTIDFGAACLLTDFELHWRTDNNSSSSIVQADCWLDEGHCTRIINQKVEPLKAKKPEEKVNIVAHNLNKVARFVKINAKPFNPNSYEGATLVINAYGIMEYLSPNLPANIFIPKLKAQLQATEEKHHILTSEFAAKRRSLTMKLEEINISGDDFQSHKSEVLNAYNECIQAQYNHHKTSRRLKRLKAMASDINSTTESSHKKSKTSDNSLDRWTRAAEHLSLLLLKEHQFSIENKKLIEDQFRNYCVYGSMTLRTQVGRWIIQQLGDWTSFPSDILHQYFSMESATLSPLNLFPQQEVYTVLQEIVSHEVYSGYVEHLFSFLDELTATPKIDLSLTSWVLLLLSNTLPTSIIEDYAIKGDPSSKPLRSLFSLLSSPQPLGREIMLLDSRVLKNLATQYSPDDVLCDIFQHPYFGHFVKNVATYGDAFLRNTVLELLESLSMEESFQLSEISVALTECKNIIKKNVAELLIKKPPLSETASTFLLELLLSVQDSGFDDNLTHVLLEFLKSSPLVKMPAQSHQIRAAREVCMTFRLLQRGDASKLNSYPLLDVFKSALIASPEHQILLQLDFNEMIAKLLSTPASIQFQDKILELLVDTFPHAQNEENPHLYTSLVATLKEHVKTGTFEIKHVVALLQSIASGMPDFYELNSTVKEKKTKPLLRSTLDLVNTILPSMRPSHLQILKATPLPSFSQKFLEWLPILDTISPIPGSGTSVVPPSAMKELDLLRAQVLTLINLLSQSDEGAKQFIQLCLTVMKQSTSSTIANLLLKLIRNEELAFYFTTHQNGFEFLYSHIMQSSGSIPPSLLSITTAIRSHITSTTSIESPIADPKPKDFSESLNPFAVVLSDDSLLAKITKEGAVASSSSSISSIWTHQFQKDKLQYPITISLSTDAVITEIQMHALQNYRVSNVNSQFPLFVRVETGTSLSRLIPCGEFPCNPNPNQTSPSSCYTSCFKFKIGSDVVRFVRLYLQCPDKSVCVALSKIQLRGYTLGSFTTTQSSMMNSSNRLSLVSLELLSHCLSFTKTQQEIAKKEISQPLQLLERLSVSTHSYIQSILLSLAKHNTELSWALLQNLLIEGQTHYHAKLAGKLCSLQDAQTGQRLHSLRDFVFEQLKKQPHGLSSYLIPYLNSLSFATSNLSWVKVRVEPDEMNSLLECAAQSLDGSLMEEGSVKLSSAFAQNDPSNFLSLLNFIKEFSVDELLTTKYDILRIIGMICNASTVCSGYMLDSQIPHEIAKRILRIIADIKDGTDFAAGINPQTSQHILQAALHFFAIIGHYQAIKTWIGEQLFDSLFSLCLSSHSSATVVHPALSVFRVCSNLHPENQAKIAKNLLNYVQNASAESIAQQTEACTGSLNDLILQLMVDMFSFENKIIVCLHAMKESQPDDLLSTVDDTAPKLEPIRIDPNFCNPSLDIDELTLKTVTASDRAKYVWRTSLGTRCMKSGIHKWEVVINKTTSTCNIMVGVCEQHQQLNAYPGGADHNASGWAFYGCHPGYVYHNSRNKEYGEHFRTGDVIGVVLDMDEGTLSFSKNGVDFGTAFSSGLLGKELYPSISLYDVGDTVTIREEVEETKTVTNISAFTLDFHSPLRLQRSLPMLNSPLLVSLHELELVILGHEAVEKSLEFRILAEKISEEPLPKMTTLSSLYHMLKRNEEIIDLVVDIKSIPALEIPPRANPPAPVASVFQIFAEKQGLSKLVTLLFSQLEETERNTSVDERGKLRRLSQWKSWLVELSSYLKVPGYYNLFICDPTCCDLLFKLLRGIKMEEELDETKENFQSLLFEPIQAIMFQLLKEGDSEGAIEVRTSLLQSGGLELILIRLSAICAVEHRKPEHFDKFNKLIETNKIKDAMEKERKEQEEAKKSNAKTFWAKGTGYGTNSDSSSNWNHVDYMKQQDLKAKHINQILQGLLKYLGTGATTLPGGLCQIIEASCMVPILEGYLRNDSLLDMGRHTFLYITVLQIVRAIVSQDNLISLIDSLSHQSASIFDLMENLNTMAEVILKRLGPATTTISQTGEISSDSTPATKQGDAVVSREKEASAEEQVVLSQEINKTCNFVKKQIDRHRKLSRLSQQEQTNESLDIDTGSLEERYRKTLKKLQFGEISMVNEKGEYVHHYKSRIVSESIAATGVKIKRLIQEVGSLSNGLPLYFDSSIFLRVDEERIDVMQCLMTGPEGTPYDNGCFQFDIYCPSEYPDTPPVVNLQTTGGGSVRFNPNLYNCGKVCLSLLGTWSGGSNEKWNAKTSTLLQVLVSIQSLILVEQPYFNEPGYETQMGTPQGTQKSNEYNEVIRVATVRWAMLEQLRNPSPGFEEAIRTHFKLKRASVLKQVSGWLKEAQASRTAGHFQKLKRVFEDLKVELQKLDPAPLELEQEKQESEDKNKREVEVASKRWMEAEKLVEIGGFPIGLCFKALELNSDKADEAVYWLFEQGEAYLLNHPELFHLKGVPDTPTDEKKGGGETTNTT